MADNLILDSIYALHQTIGDALIGDLIYFLLGFQELLLQNIWYLADEILLAMVLIVIKHLLEGHKSIVANERRQLDSKVF